MHFDAKTCHVLEEVAFHEGQASINVVKYSKGLYIGLGTSDGAVFCWPTNTLENKADCPIKCSNKAISQLAFNEPEDMLAFADSDHIIGLLQRSENDWTLKARFKVHAKPVNGLVFFGTEYLHSIGLDRRLCKINLTGAFKANKCSLNLDPLLISVLGDFLAVLSQNQLSIHNPDTLLCRKIVKFGGIPKVNKLATARFC